MRNVENDEFKMEDSIENETIYSIINDEGILESVQELVTTLFQSPNLTDNDEDLYKSELYNRIYDDNNQISYKDIMKDNNETKSLDNRLIFNITKLLINGSHIINCSEYYTNEELNQFLYRYFDSFNFKLYEKKEEYIYDNNETLKDKEVSKKRNLQEINEFYGQKKISYIKQIYSYNLIGLRMEKQILSEINPSTGITNSYVIIIFGNKNLKIKLQEQYSNLHIITEKKNQMGYNLIKLLDQSNINLINKSKNYLDVIIDIEKNITNLFENDFDYSNLFKDSLINMYNEVQNFTGNFFEELIRLINRIYDNYTIILNNAQNKKYDVINKIRKITKEEYIHYIYNMLNILELFQNNTLKFLDNIEEELENINTFHIDLLYDIKDEIYESRLIFKQFNRNLFKSIEKGIITFKYNLTEYIDETIGDLLYITDFLSVNIDKNEILKNAIDDTSKKDVKLKLKNFRNIILTIIDLLISDINNDFQNEMNLGSNNSIKFISNQKAESFLYNTEDKSNKVIDDIKKRINNIELFELYSNNIDIINNINNKTIIENINEIYNNIIYNFIQLQPEYYNKKNDIFIKKDKLFEITKRIVNKINNDIDEINNFIINYTQNYMEAYLYDMHYNLYNFRNYLIKNGFEHLSNEINNLLNNTFNIYLKYYIDYNLDISISDFKDAIEFFEECNYKKKLIGRDVTEAYKRGVDNFKKFTELISSEEISNIIEKYTKTMKNNIINNVSKKILTINKYYFNNELYKDIFYQNEQIYNEIIKLIEEFDSYFNEIYFANIKIKTSDLISSILSYQNSKTQEFINIYNILLGKLTKNKFKNSNKYDFYCSGGFLGLESSKVKFYSWGVDYMKTNLKNIEVENYIKTNYEKIILNFEYNYEKYLNYYISKSNLLYSNLYNYIQNKIDNNYELDFLLKDYQMIFNSIIKNDSNDGLLEKIYNYNNNIMNNINIYLNNLNNNINLLIDKYYSLYYLKNSSKFLEYPEEIIYKINQILKELNASSLLIKDLTNINYEKKIKSIIHSTNTFIQDIIKNHFNYIIININKSIIMKEYYLNYYLKLNTTFNGFMDILQTAFSNISADKILFFNNQNYDEPIKKILKDSKNIISYLEDIIYKNFTSQNCFPNLMNNTYIDENNESINDYSDSINEYNETMYNYNDSNDNLICIEEKKKFDLNISKYNYYIVKLREGIYYSKSLLENVDILVNEFNFDKLINMDKIIFSDELLNDKDIIYIYNETNYKLNKIKEDSSLLVDEYFQLFMEDFKKKYSYNDDYLNLLEKFKEIIMFKDSNYQNDYNDKKNYIFSLINEFNETLYKQFFLTKQYDFYNFNKNKFNETFLNYYSQIEKNFSIYIYKIESLNKNNIFHNSIRTIFRKLQDIKRVYFKNIINDISKNYDFNLSFMSYNLGENTRYFIEKEYYDYEFSHIYDYVELFENYTHKYLKKIVLDITNLKNFSKEKLKKIYDSFYSNFNQNASNFINIDYIKESEYNKTFCLDYSYEILKEKKRNNEIIYEKYNKYLELINLTFIKCLNNDSDIIDTGKYSIEEKIDYIQSIKYDCLNYLSKLENESDYSEPKNLLDCYINNFYNSNIFYFNNFENTYKRELDEIIKKIKFNISFFDEYSFLSNLEKNYTLISYENITFTDMSNDFYGIEGIINFINYIKNDEYKKYLSDLLINSFNKSYFNYINNYVLEEVIDNITLLINNRFNLHLKYIEKKLIDEYYYYILILNNTEEIGESSKNAFLNLYKNINKKLNDTFYYLIKEDIYFYLNIFFKDYKKIVRNNFIDYYIYNLNKYDFHIFKLKEFFEDIILDINFNKSIDLISTDITENLIFKNLNIKIIELLDSEILNIFNITNSLQLQIKKVLDEKKIKFLPDNMNIINELIINYTEIVKNQNNHFLLKISDKPFIHLDDFIHKNLEPPLILIREKYNEIENILIDKILNITHSFPDFYLIVKDKLQLESIHENISLYLDALISIFDEYKDFFNIEFKDYINKLVHYTYINGLHTFDEPCNYSFCKINLDSNNTRRRNEEQKINKKKILYNSLNITINKSQIEKFKNKKIRKLEGYDYTMGAITEYDIIDYLLNINYTLYSFIETYFGDEYKKLNQISNIFLMKINNTYLQLLKRSIHMIIIKFSTILTKSNYNYLENNLYEKYNEISHYINNNSDFINVSKIYFENILNTSTVMLYYYFNISYYQIRGYYLILCDLIQNQMKYLSEEEIKAYKLRLLNEEEEDDEDKNEFPDMPNNLDADQGKSYSFASLYEPIYRNCQDMLEKLRVHFNKKFEVKSNWFKEHTIFNRDEEGKIWKSVFTEEDFEMEVNVGIIMDKNKTSISFGACIDLFHLNFTNNYFTFTFPFATWIKLVLAIIPSLKIELCFNTGFIINWNASEYLFFIDICGKAEVGLTLDLGIYIPGPKSIVSISINIGLHGVIGSGAVGVKLFLYLNKDKFIVDTYFQIVAFQFTFYILFRLTINLDKAFFKIFKLEKITYEFIIYSYKFASLIDYEYHIQRGYAYNRSDIPKLCKNKGEFNMNFFSNEHKEEHGGKCQTL